MVRRYNMKGQKIMSDKPISVNLETFIQLLSRYNYSETMIKQFQTDLLREGFTAIGREQLDSKEKAEKLIKLLNKLISKDPKTKEEQIVNAEIKFFRESVQHNHYLNQKTDQYEKI